MEELKINKNTLEYGNLMDLIHTVSQMTDAEWKMYSSENNLPYEKSEYITILKNKEDDLNEASTTSGVPIWIVQARFANIPDRCEGKWVIIGKQMASICSCFNKL